ncbi:MarR family transcriptional regulator [Vibrio sp. SCSIO 43136]|uniref:MarR family winged helix-turn-helix transcriptional regulator n=1 Tax=Vibrio sp. SCSIO 43136 TaxID=2819101 RepID=UPI002074DB65|nr:MarR family transcriptional regulator [Vibrio sp. SCSIO 43136]USD68191.1 MarR family transcriptional regulator [Vibrio sp. SCSIO 43136]
MANTSCTPDNLKLENQICFALYSATNAMTRAYRPLLDELDLTYLQYLAMMVLWSEDGINVKELGKKLNLDSGTLTPLMKRLESKGLVNRRRGDSDERVRNMFLTEQGLALKDKAESVPEKLRCQVQLQDDELLSLKKMCEQLTNNLK